MNNINHNQTQRTCAICNKQLEGRSDKIYCDIKCKNHYHSQKRKEIKTVYEIYGRIAYNNAEILSSLMNETNDSLEISELELQRIGFNFQNVSSWECRNGTYIFKIFNYSWYRKEKNTIIISRDNAETDVSPFMFRRWNTRYPADNYSANHFESIMPSIHQEIQKMKKTNYT